MIDYDDVRLVAAIAGAGGVRGAQARLGTHIATIYRQLRELEKRTGGALFERLGDALVPTGRSQELAMPPVTPIDVAVSAAFLMSLTSTAHPRSASALE